MDFTMKEKEKQLFKALCKFKDKFTDPSLIEFATPAVLGHLFFNRMQGGSAAGANDGPVEQGYVWHYMGVVPSEVKMNFTLDYPEESYWGGMFPNIVHFCEKPAETTPPPTITVITTTAAKEGCGSTVTLSALALVPMLGTAVVFGKKRED